MFNLKQTNMNVKSLMLLLALAGLGASCSDDEATGGGPSSIAGRSELQIVFSGSGESQSYDKTTKAIATAKENQIDDLQIYLFAAASEGGPYYYLETWQDGTAYNPEDKDGVTGNPKTNFKKTEAGTGWKASLYPNELAGVPYIKLFCIANKNVPGMLASDGATPSQTTDEKFYQEDGATEILATLTPVTTAAAGDGTYTVTPGTTETEFIASFTKALGAAANGVISTPLLMTGQGKTKISGNVSKVDIDLTRVVARFDIDNTTSKSNLTIKKVTLAQGRKTAPLWTAAITPVDKADLTASALIAQKYETVDFEKLTGANQGITESSLYVYPTLATDESYLILEGTYKSPVNSSQVPVTYHVPIVRTPEGGDKGEYIAINANNRYCLRITEVHPWTDTDGNRYTEYQLKKKESPANTSDFNLVFTSKLTEQGITAPGFKLTLNKAYSKPKITPNADPSTYTNSTFNDGAPIGYPYAVTADMYKVDNSTIYLQMACTEEMTVTSSDANVTASKQGDTNYYKIEVTNAADAADEVTITATNNNDATRKATVTLTLVDPATKLENPGGGVTPTLSGTTVTLPNTYAQYGVSTFDIVAPKGSTVTCGSSTWFTCTPSGTATIDGTKKQAITLMGGDQSSTADVTITVHNSVTNADETITVTKAVAP